MAFYIESRFVDIRTLVDFEDFNESDLNSPQIVNSSNNSSNLQPIQSQESLEDSQALEKITEILVQTEIKTEITNPINAEIIKETNDLMASEIADPIVEIVDKTSLYINFINQKYDKDLAAEFIKILLNPFIVILAYRYEFLSPADNNSFSFNLRHLKNIDSKKINEFEENPEISIEQNLQTDFQIYNRKKEIERKLQRKPN